MTIGTTSSLISAEQFFAGEKLLDADQAFADSEREQEYWIEDNSGWEEFTPPAAAHLREAIAVKFFGVHMNVFPKVQYCGVHAENVQVIDQARKVLGLSMTQLAQVLGVSRKTVYNYKGQKVGSMSRQPEQRLTLLKLALKDFVVNHGTQLRSPPRALTVNKSKGEETVLEKMSKAITLEEFAQVLEELVEIGRALEPSRPQRDLDPVEMLTETRGSYFGPES